MHRGALAGWLMVLGCAALPPQAAFDAGRDAPVPALDAGDASFALDALDVPDVDDADAADDGDAADGSRDAADASSCDTPRTPGCACSTPGATDCSLGSGRGVQCCGGVWQEFFDGACEPIDAGAPSCGDLPARGCPCAEEDAIACRMIYQWRLRCRLGTWIEDIGFVCC